jgi:tRNA threonylcarbamoyladenosine biosynthesis protein TsaB
MEFYMVVLALDTTTRRGSVAIARDSAIVEARAGDPTVAHAQRLPGDLIRVLDDHALRVADVDLFAIAAGPGSFTGLRIGIATMQGLALATGKDVVGVSTFDALYRACRVIGEVGVWLDAQRGEVFSAVYRDGMMIEGPSAEKPADVLARWARTGADSITVIGEGAVMYADLIRAVFPTASVADAHPMLAPSVALLAREQRRQQGSSPPDTIRPLYVRRPDVELARDRKAGH